jgi:Zn finger protein HypA/HybF involved in hydrogenase expression
MAFSDTMQRASTADAQAKPTAQPCHLSPISDRPGEVRCPVCHHLVPPEHIGYKLHCRRCGYLESCCNPI